MFTMVEFEFSAIENSSDGFEEYQAGSAGEG